MSRRTQLILFVVGAAVFTGPVYLVSGNREMHLAAREGDAMAWLRAEFAWSA